MYSYILPMKFGKKKRGIDKFRFIELNRRYQKKKKKKKEISHIGVSAYMFTFKS